MKLFVAVDDYTALEEDCGHGGGFEYDEVIEGVDASLGIEQSTALAGDFFGVMEGGGESGGEELCAEGFGEGAALFGLGVLLGDEEREAVGLIAVVAVVAFVGPDGKVLRLNGVVMKGEEDRGVVVGGELRSLFESHSVAVDDEGVDAGILLEFLQEKVGHGAVELVFPDPACAG